MSEPTAEPVVRKGSCSCGSVAWAVQGKPIFHVFCHCTGCQRADGAAFVSSMHYSSSAFSWVHGAEVEPIVENLDGMVLYRCQKCRSCAAAHMSNGNWALRGTQLERGEDEKIINWDDIKPTGHIFYGTRVVDVADNLPKWEGYQNSSKRLG